MIMQCINAIKKLIKINISEKKSYYKFLPAKVVLKYPFLGEECYLYNLQSYQTFKQIRQTKTTTVKSL